MKVGCAGSDRQGRDDALKMAGDGRETLRENEKEKEGERDSASCKIQFLRSDNVFKMAFSPLIQTRTR